jgi:hypothetical protein
LRVGRSTEQTFKSMLGKSGYSKKASEEIWKWYTVQPKKRKIPGSEEHS